MSVLKITKDFVPKARSVRENEAEHTSCMWASARGVRQSRWAKRQARKHLENWTMNNLLIIKWKRNRGIYESKCTQLTRRRILFEMWGARQRTKRSVLEYVSIGTAGAVTKQIGQKTSRTKKFFRKLRRVDYNFNNLRRLTEKPEKTFLQSELTM